MKPLLVVVLMAFSGLSYANEMSKISIDGRHFSVNGHDWVAIGVNYFPFDNTWPPKPWINFDVNKIKKDFEVLRSIGINSIRLFMTFSFINDDFGLNAAEIKKLDETLKIAKENGLYVLLVGPTNWEGVPNWARDNRFGDLNAIKGIERFWDQIASRYKGNVVILGYDLYNEPRVSDGANDINPNWDGRYSKSQLLKREQIASNWVNVMVKAVKRSDPAALVTIGLAQGSFPLAIKKNKYYSAFRVDKLATDLDFVQFHFYPKYGEAFLDYSNNKQWMANEAALEWIGDVVASVGKPVILGEFGWYGGGEVEVQGRRLKLALEEDQEKWVTKVVNLTKSYSVGWYNWSMYDYPASTDVTRFSGLVSSSGQPKKIGLSYSTIIHEAVANSVHRVRSVTGEKVSDDWDKLLNGEIDTSIYFKELLKRFENKQK